MISHDFRLNRDPFGRLVLTIDGRFYNAVVPVRSFPISAPDQGIALMGPDGAELVWMDSLEELPGDARELLTQELASREFMPEVRRIRHVSSFATPSRWQVETDRGDVELVLKAEEDIRRLSASTLLIADNHGVQYLIRDVPALDKTSRRLLDHFL
ncbi:DUF1854 domain-containing protein [Paralcaligenes sp. KSB-10]|uniref:cyanophycin metabolism-associated DUF1854 family protein n=1 Tax=Paralcaligenes sp. KSB-10 TaxID=2901142 RepID=UPI001E2A9F98|nr:DUF1854 domain-containing protein [Paralcaligenes sp. KSB-10]UHL66402.1 DUF1854 domain-containing protein [Paralcaligenes sp. KSB-10]